MFLAAVSANRSEITLQIVDYPWYVLSVFFMAMVVLKTTTGLSELIRFIFLAFNIYLVNQTSNTSLVSTEYWRVYILIIVINKRISTGTIRYFTD